MVGLGAGGGYGRYAFYSMSMTTVLFSSFPFILWLIVYNLQTTSNFEKITLDVLSDG